MRTAFLLSALLLPLAADAQTWQNADVRGYGYVNGLLIHPQTQTVYSRTDVAGIFRWDGARWTNLLDGEFTRSQLWPAAAEAFALDPRVPGRLWVALGNNLTSEGEASLVVRSDDDGQTWTATNFPPTVGMAGNGSWRRSGEQLAADPNDSDVVYFASHADGLWRTVNGGASWGRVTSFPSLGDEGGPGDGPCPEVDPDGCGPGGLSFVVFDDRTTVTIAGRTVTANVYVGALGDGVWRSADGGRTWALAVPGPGTRDNPMRAAFTHGRLQVGFSGDGGFAGDGAILVYVPDGSGSGGTVADKTPPEACPLYGTYDWNEIASHPTDPDFVVAIPYGVVARKVFFTRNFTDPNPTWEIQTDEGPYAECPAQQLDYTLNQVVWAGEEDGAFSYGGAAAFDLEDPRRVWFTTGWGVYRFDDLVADGTTLDFAGVMAGLEESCVHDVEAPGGSGPAVYSAAFDTFGWAHRTVAEVPATSFDFGVQQNATDVAVTPADPLLAVVVGARNGGYLPAGRVTRDGGLTWSDLGLLGDPNDPDDACEAFLTAGNIAVSATDPDRMVWSPQSAIWPACNGFSAPVVTPPHLSADGGQTWQPVQGMDFDGGNWATGTDFVVSQHLVADAVDGDRFYAYVKQNNASGTVGIWASADGGATWSEQCRGCVPDFRFPRLAAHPQRAGEVWGSFVKTFGVDAQADLLRSTDGGQTWSQIATADSVWAFGFGAPLAGETNATLYAHALISGVEDVWYSTDDAATWRRFAGTVRMPTGLIEDLAGDPDEAGVLYAGTGCRGLWEGRLDRPTSTGIATRSQAEAPLLVPYPNPASRFARVTVTLPEAGRYRVVALDALGRAVAEIRGEARAGAPQTVGFDVRAWSAGTYTLRLEAGSRRAAQRLTVLR